MEPRRPCHIPFNPGDSPSPRQVPEQSLQQLLAVRCIQPFCPSLYPLDNSHTCAWPSNIRAFEFVQPGALCIRPMESPRPRHIPFNPGASPNARKVQEQPLQQLPAICCTQPACPPSLHQPLHTQQPCIWPLTKPTFKFVQPCPLCVGPVKAPRPRYVPLNPGASPGPRQVQKQPLQRLLAICCIQSAAAHVACPHEGDVQGWDGMLQLEVVLAQQQELGISVCAQAVQKQADAQRCCQRGCSDQEDEQDGGEGCDAVA